MANPKNRDERIHHIDILKLSVLLIGYLLAWTPLTIAQERLVHSLSNDEAIDSLRLEQVIRDVIEHNDRIAAANYMEQSSNAKIGPAGAWDDPMLMVGVVNLPPSFDFKMDDMTMKMIGITQKIPYAGEKGLLKKAAKSEAGAANAERRAMEVDLAMAAKFAYFDLFYSLKNLDDLRRQADLQNQVVSSAIAKLTSNQAGQDEVLAAQADLWRFEAMILTAETEVSSARFTLNSLRGLNVQDAPRPLASPPIISIPEKADQWLADAERNYASLRRLQHSSAGYGFLAAASNRMRWPMLDLSANYGLRENGPMGPRDNMLGFQATLSIPIFAGRQQGKMAQSMSAMQKSTDAEYNQLLREVRADLLTLHEKTRRFTESLKLYRNRIIPAEEDAFHSALAGYASNRIAFASLLTYSMAIYRDRIAANEIARELAQTLARAERYITDPTLWSK